jgi:hypothetical protein
MKRWGRRNRVSLSLPRRPAPPAPLEGRDGKDEERGRGNKDEFGFEWKALSLMESCLHDNGIVFL